MDDLILSIGGPVTGVPEPFSRMPLRSIAWPSSS
jgi:hypothetical protein